MFNSPQWVVMSIMLARGTPRLRGLGSSRRGSPAVTKIAMVYEDIGSVG
ncbi:hypothetical protein HMPREF9622_01419 [Cutibacterium modestum HL037PA3]|nr:hypothetical protein HMPREF9621_01033 [Cutibacterium modestum HL037PA2]EFT15644.1 hypothetical protein HMPREF9622_01419 [Cutibacterium modestum HL037PA3]